MQATLFLSNRQEKLIECFKERIITAEDSPFSRRWVVMPNRLMKNWLFSQMATHFSITSGITLLSVNQLKELLSSISLTSPCELSLHLDELLTSIAKKERDNSLFAPLLPLLNPLLSQHKLAWKLAQEFSLLGRALPIHNKKWEENPKTWQEVLWQRLFAAYNPFANVVLRKTEKEVHSIHLFGLPHLFSSELAFFEKVGQEMPLFFYFLSPCLEFFGDNLSAQEIDLILKTKKASHTLQIAFEESFSDQNPLLGELGKVKRKLINEIVESKMTVLDAYEEIEETNNLTMLQSALLHNRKSEWVKEDSSISFYSYSTRRLEIEGLYQQLSRLMEDGHIEPRDVLVLAPDMDVYTPYIEAFFGGKMDYRYDYPITHAPLFEGLHKLFSIEKERWSEEALLDLFSFPSWMQKQKWSRSDSELIFRWIKRASIHFGYDVNHLKALLSFPHLEEGTHTWMAGMDRLFSLLAMGETIEMTEAPLLGQLSSLLSQLYLDLAPVREEQEKKLFEWCDFVENLSQAYLTDEIEELSRCLEPLRKEQVLSFSSFLFYFEKILEDQRRTSRDSHLQAVTFSSLFVRGLIPAKVIVLIGMNEEAFPRHEEKSFTLDMQKESSVAIPNRPEIDRSLFLEVILSARQHLLLSYIGRDPLDQKELLPSPLVSLLHRFLGFPTIHVSMQAPRKPSSLSSPREEKKRACEKPLYIDLKELELLVRSPLRLYFQMQEGFDFSFSGVSKEEEEFLLPNWKISTLRRSLLRAPLPDVLKEAKKRGDLPDNRFFDLAKKRLEEEEHLIRQAKASCGLTDIPLSLEFSPTVSAIEQVEKGHWLAPPLDLQHPKEIYLMGKIEGIAEKSLIVLEKCHLAALIKHLPAFLALNMAPTPFQRSVLFFAKDKEMKESSFDGKKQLHQLIDYYFFATQTPSFLFPTYVDALLKQDKSLLEKAMEESLSRGFDEALHFAKRADLIPKLDEIMALSVWAKRLYQEIADAWF